MTWRNRRRRRVDIQVASLHNFSAVDVRVRSKSRAYDNRRGGVHGSPGRNTRAGEWVVRGSTILFERGTTITINVGRIVVEEKE